ncbi:MAG: DUF2141 domain-containing protein [Bacteroidetes bacterium]|nr:DUF2141 domain-containing protein [Bacteroidota bacterium]MDA1268296.1 DUF2141 domain-containing protein [Bacteroidota bacterium]
MKTLLLLITFIFSSTLSAQTNSSIQVYIQGASSDKGMIRVLLFTSSAGFPDQISRAVNSFSMPSKNKEVAFTINDLAPGTYALAVIHDQDSNGKLSSNAVGYPIEKFGFSNNPKVYFSPPSFEKASFVLGKTPIKVNIILR